MSDSTATLQRKISNAGELEAVVRTMKALAASSISQYERAVNSLDEYYRTVQLGLLACLRQGAPMSSNVHKHTVATGVIIFGSDQGLVGQFNDELADFAAHVLRDLPGNKVVWAVGERVQLRLEQIGLTPDSLFGVPTAIHAVTPLIGRILAEIGRYSEQGRVEQVYIFHNRPKSGALYEPVSQRLLPLDATWQHELLAQQWPTQNLPEIIGESALTLAAFIREYLFVSLFRSCVESLASENASRLAAMQRAEKNIEEMLVDLRLSYHRLRQSGIDAELFDVVSGFELLISNKKK
ncbi:F0F1 ATP synthase subunit gamma [Sulfuriferula nivalis]|uniref:F0F1 ATP synthase subunit gamma n=1 Tax=Sulfuriferula nivalis TaxID=2675298 RepID=A0A809SE32_9PROT|nr:F0F1 ATP synthase subunit gamma [Sulfuriferula nivalis]BBP01077.1 F0F1 ATP synthase subunit gamma [Sulfuriferula nivalis]